MSFDSFAGRTLIARILFRTAVLNGYAPAQLVCFDIDQPDLLDYFENKPLTSEEIFANQPVTDLVKCNYCGQCSSYCPEKAIQFNRFVPSVNLIVSRCAACSICVGACGAKGRKMKKRFAGKVLQAQFGRNSFIAGQSNKESEFNVPLVNALLARLRPDSTVICDFGPGNGTSVSKGLVKMDIAAIVVQPDSDWKKNLELMLNMVEKSNAAYGIILNNVKQENSFISEVQSYCSSLSIPLFGTVNYDKNLESDTKSGIFEIQGEPAPEFAGLWNGLVDLFPVSAIK